MLTAIMLASLAVSGDARAEVPRTKYNVLVICVDDLRPQLGCYGCKEMISPNIDRLAAEGRQFNRHYVQSAVCGPSRCSLLTGTRQGTWDCWSDLRKQEREPRQPASFAHLFRRHSYRTVSIGKVSHEPGGTMPPDYRVHQVPFSWDLAFCPSGAWENPWRAFFSYAGGKAYNKVIRWTRDEPPRLPFEAADVPDEGYADGLIARAAVEQLGELARRDGPFLLAVGFFKPHLPHNAPKKYWDLYDRETVGLAPNSDPPAGVDPEISCHPSFEVTSHYDWPGGLGHITEEQARNQRHAYFACTSYVDAQIGKVLAELRRLGLQRSTVVVLWGDHGWHLGEHGMFGKQTNFEVATRSPLIIRVPDMARPGEATDALAETVDVYPTLADLCGLPLPDGLAGTSLVPVVEDPSAAVQDAAMSFHPRGKLLGCTLRTDRYRIVEWADRRSGKTAQVELYDHRTDPQENRNVAREHPEVVKDLLKRLEAIKPSLRNT